MPYLIDVHLANALIEYLATKPFHEVHRLIGALQALQPHTPATDAPTAQPAEA